MVEDENAEPVYLGFIRVGQNSKVIEPIGNYAIPDENGQYPPENVASVEELAYTEGERIPLVGDIDIDVGDDRAIRDGELVAFEFSEEGGEVVATSATDVLWAGKYHETPDTYVGAYGRKTAIINATITPSNIAAELLNIDDQIGAEVRPFPDYDGAFDGVVENNIVDIPYENRDRQFRRDVGEPRPFTATRVFALEQGSGE